MFKRPADINSIRRQFGNAKALLTRVVGNVPNTGDPRISSGIQDVSKVVQMLDDLERTVDEYMIVKQNRLEALTRIGSMINSSLGRERVLEQVMSALIDLTHAERGFLMSRESNGELKFEIARGMSNARLGEDEFKVSMTIARRVAESGEPILTTNAQDDPRFENQFSVAAFKLRSILCVPLKVKGELIGVIYVDNKAHVGMFGEEDRELIKAFADQAAVAIDNARLFDELLAANTELENTNFKLEAANLELKIAYDATLNGWVRALDLRDKETEGHTQRVTILTERLARMLGVVGDDLLDMTRGALLHDIGKMAISDLILRKEGPLTEAEREEMKKHPVYAYEMLSPIEFLRGAIDIPYCHHEKWDGTGYPRGLKGEQIPFAARIFPVVDVWDALTSDRPYRKSMPPDEVREIIKADAGTHFDPKIVEVFLQMEDLSV